jgi:hypothetical protein
MNDELEQKLQQQLRASEDGLDGPTLARLHAARNRALETAGGRHLPRWSGTWLTAAAAGVAAIALFINLRQPADQEQIAAAELESTLLAVADGDEIIGPVTGQPVTGENGTTETMDLLENLDFYEWLSQEAVKEQST